MSLLLSPASIGSLSLKNRIVMPPMCLYSATHEGHATPFHTLHYGARALGETGLIIVEATGVEPRGRISDKDLGLWNDAHIASHKSLTDTCHFFGAAIGVQLAHAGRKCECADETPIAPSALAFSDAAPYKTPKAMSLEEIATVTDAFVQSALRAQKAGYDVVEIHGAHGYLLCEFLSPLSNQREDQYGGNLENRCRFLLEVVTSIKKAITLPVIVRLSAHEWMKEGWQREDTLILAKALEKAGVDALHISSGGNQAAPDNRPRLVPLYQVGEAKAIKNKVGIPVIAVGQISTPIEAEALLIGETCDFVAFGRELLRNPHLGIEAAKLFKEPTKIPAPYARAYL
ncbi:MAG: NADH:flavin oxidoreductase/NADH oxidase [Campylobacterales bacterium]|nr:NADH:flavin oxidoreductase/NADH oxidase [Campylobacterales bacterium]